MCVFIFYFNPDLLTKTTALLSLYKLSLSFKLDMNKFNTIATLSVNCNGSNGTQPMVNKLKNQNFEFDTNSNCPTDILNESFTSSINSSTHMRKGAPLYIICERSQVKVNLYIFCLNLNFNLVFVFKNAQIS